ncbi:flavin reductase family protein [Tistrella mobilis]|uniref:Flavin reductase-like, FMN-binding protein n=1 Tax=Tistrella mobilis (strain KA081020-065) TaxID=1110502 RepID=I3TLJ8_TISMK|nr:flavin reductase family protein [Tistrella mobilis]AFK53636.1 flavin reductase-like, FMN-binding protein [Tistrella mobilis KA081020-065]
MSVARRFIKQELPLHLVRRHLEPGPVVLLTSAQGTSRNVMTLGWQTVMEFSPSLVGCMISAGNHSFELIRQSGSCVINVPPANLIDTVVGIGNTSGADIDKFETYSLTTEPGVKVPAPSIAECFASFECRLSDDRLVESHNFFVFEIVHATVARLARMPRTLHYTGDGVFMISGRRIDKSALFNPHML